MPAAVLACQVCCADTVFDFYSLDLGVNSFSDNNNDLSLASISNSASSTSDSDAKSCRYVSTAPVSGVAKQEQSQQVKAMIVSKSQCNRKIHHFLEKYANVKQREFPNLIPLMFYLSL